MSSGSPIPLAERLESLLTGADPATTALSGIAILLAILMLLASERRVELLLLLVTASAAFVGSTVDTVDSLAAVLRWCAIAALLLVPLSVRGAHPRGATLLFFGYAVAGAVFLVNATDIVWQVQRALLLLAAAVALPSAVAACGRDGPSLRRLFAGMGLIGALYGLVAAVALPAQLGQAARFAGGARGVPHFAMVLGCLLPFTLFAVWHLKNRLLQHAAGAGALLSCAALVFTGQRTGTIAGLAGSGILILSLDLTRKVRVALACIAFLILGLAWEGDVAGVSLGYVAGRYLPAEGLSGRDLIWRDALSLILAAPLTGHGTGAAEYASEASFHNAYLEAWYNAGWPGLLLFLAAFARAMVVAGGVLRRGSVEERPTAALALGSVLSVAFMSFFESGPAGASTMPVIVFLVVSAAAELLREHKKGWVLRRRWVTGGPGLLPPAWQAGRMEP